MSPVLWRVFPVAVVAAVVLALWKVPDVPAAGVHYVRIAAGPATTPSFAAATALAAAASRPPGMPPCDPDGACGVDGVIVLAQSQPTPAAVLAAVAAGQVETGLVPADLLVDARCGTGRSSSALRGVRLLSNIYSESLQILVRADLDAHSVADLRGRRLAMGTGGSPERRLAEQLLAAHGLKRRDVRPIDVDGTAALDLLDRGGVDALAVLAPSPDAALAPLLESGRFVLLPVDGAAAARLAALRPSLAAAQVPAGTYGLLRDVPTLASAVAWVAAPDFQTELAGSLADAAWRPANRSLISQKADLAFTGPAGAFARAAAPLHAGVAGRAAPPDDALACPGRSS